MSAEFCPKPGCSRVQRPIEGDDPDVLSCIRGHTWKRGTGRKQHERLMKGEIRTRYPYDGPITAEECGYISLDTEAEKFAEMKEEDLEGMFDDQDIEGD